MSETRSGLRRLLVPMLLLAATACTSQEPATSAPPSAPAAAAAPASSSVTKLALRVSGPHVHDNLTVWLIHSDDRDERDFLTLDEGLAQGLVAVSEQASAQVNQLLIENLSDRPLFLQEGDRVRG